MEEVVQRGNAKAALKRVRQNKGSPGVDGMTVGELPEYLAEHWETIRDELLAGTYQPKPVKRQEIPKSGGGVRELGIPTALDRFVQQAILQVLQPRFDPTFSEHSHGFRPGRRAHDAVCEAQRYIQDGRRVVVDVDLEKFFDRVNHDVLMGKLSARIVDKRMLGLIRRYLEAGVMVNGVVMERGEGTPQGGPLSPLLANVLLDEDGNAYLADFGIAKDDQNIKNAPDDLGLAGTLAYSAPEQITGGPIDPRTDIYCLGIMLYEMLAGKLAFPGETITDTARQHAREMLKQSLRS